MTHYRNRPSAILLVLILWRHHQVKIDDSVTIYYPYKRILHIGDGMVAILTQLKSF